MDQNFVMLKKLVYFREPQKYIIVSLMPSVIPLVNKSEASGQTKSNVKIFCGFGEGL